LGITDLWDGFVAPGFEDTDKDVILKCVVTTDIPFEDHIASFRPDVKILFVREPSRNLESLAKKRYRDDGGGKDDKIVRLENELQRPDRFDHVVTYEDFVHDRTKILEALRGLVTPSHYDFKRTKHDILEFNRAHSAWCRQYYRRRWDFGNIRFEGDGTVKLLSEIRGPGRPRGLAGVYQKVRNLLSGGR